LDLAAAQTLVNDLSNQDLSGNVVLDASEVTHLGALCVQALLAGARAAHAAGGSLKIENVQEKVDDQLASMGLSKELVMEGAQ
jgi:chemotaxis protein CheX